MELEVIDVHHKQGQRDTASRLAGDEFVLVCPAASGADAPGIAERLQAAVHGPMEVNGKRLVVSCSIGISVYPQDGSAALDLVQKANLAMGVAKNSGCGTWCLYRDQIQLPAVSSLELELDLREAIALEQFVVYYQPVISVDSGYPVGAEALVRWAHPVRGLLPPSEFISFAESYDLIAPIGEFVLHAACAQLQRLDLRASDDFSIAVNVSARQFTKPGFVGTVASAIGAYGLDARRLGVEITESVIMSDTAAVIATLAELKVLGVKLSLDDFGTRYSEFTSTDRGIQGRRKNGSGQGDQSGDERTSRRQYSAQRRRGATKYQNDNRVLTARSPRGTLFHTCAA